MIGNTEFAVYKEIDFFYFSNDLIAESESSTRLLFDMGRLAVECTGKSQEGISRVGAACLKYGFSICISKLKFKREYKIWLAYQADLHIH